MVGTIGPFTVAICRQSIREEASLGGGPGSAMTTAAGLTATKAVGASAHLASTMGKAPAALSAATRSVAGFSATTINGPCSDMGARTLTKMRDPNERLLILRQRRLKITRLCREGEMPR